MLTLLFSIMAAAENHTYYYKLIRIEKDGGGNTNVSGGQFVTFTDKACYESDSNGFSVHNGKLDYKYTDGGIKVYVGESYWGSHSVFLFKNDLSSLNVKTSNGEVYVYKRSSVPSNVTTCSLIRKKADGSGYYAPSFSVTPSYPQGGKGGTTTTVQNRNRGNQQTTPEYETKKKVHRTCAACNGKGTYEYNGPGTSYGTTPYKKRCPTCGWEYLSNTIHSHRPCTICHGRGYLEEWQ